MRKWSLVFVLVAALLSAMALAEPVKTEEAHPLDKYAKLTKGTTKAYLEITMVLTRTFRLTRAEDGVLLPPKTSKDAMRIVCWFDTERGLYRMTLLPEEDAKVERHVFFSPQGCIGWVTMDNGEMRISDKIPQDKTKPGEFSLLGPSSGMGPFVPWLDAMFAYKNLKTNTLVKRAESPLDDKDELHWFSVEPDPKAKNEVFLLAHPDMKNIKDAKFWLGFSPKTGWPVKYVAHSENLVTTLELTKIDTNPDLKDAFELPEAVKAKLKEAEQND